MKLLVSSLALAFAFQAHATEAVTFKADMAVTRCANDEICGAEFGDSTDITILLQKTDNSNLLKGKHEFVHEVDNYKFRGVLEAYKYTIDGRSRYMLQSMVGVTKGDTFLGYYVLGGVILKGVDQLNNINWLSPKILDEKFHYFVRMSVSAQE